MSHRNTQKNSAAAEFRRMLKWIALAAVLMVAAALAYTAAVTELTLHLTIALTLGVLVSVLLGSGLFALAFFSDKSGHDQAATDASSRRAAAKDNRGEAVEDASKAESEKEP